MKFTALILILISHTAAFADTNTQPPAITPERVSDLAFSDCQELERLLKTNLTQVTPIEKLKLAENLSNVITLKSINPSQFPGTAAAPFNQKSFDVALTLNPNSENKAKECALKVLPTLLPESTITIPNLILSAKDNSLPRALRVNMLEQARALGDATKEPLKDYTLTALLNQLKNNKQILNDFSSAPSLLPIIVHHRNEFRELSLNFQSSALTNALQILDNDGKIEVPALLSHLTANKTDINKSYILKTLADYPKHIKDILILLPQIISTLSASEISVFLDTLSAVANANLENIPSEINTKIAESLLELLPLATEKQLSNILNIIRETNLPPASTLCSPSLLLKDQSNFSFLQRLSLASLCSKQNTDQKFIKTNFKTAALENLTVTIVLLSKNEPLRKTNLEEAYNKLEALKPTLSPREYRENGYFLIAIENLNPNSNSKLIYIKLAEALLLEEPVYPSVTKYFIKSTEHPSINLLATLGKKSVPTIVKFLKNPISPALRQKGLSVVASDLFVAYPELLETVEALISDEDLDTRRQAYQILSRRSTKYPSSIRLKSTKNNSSQFYKARLSLQFTDKKNTQDRKTNTSLLFTTIPKLKCQESTVPLTDITQDDIKNINALIKENAELHLIQCLSEKGLLGRRAINTLELLSPLSENSKRNFENLLSNEKLPQLGAEEGTRYLNLIYDNSISITQIPKQVLANLFSNAPIKDQVLYSIWLMSRFSGANEIKTLLDEYFDSSVEDLVNLAIAKRENKQNNETIDLNDSFEQEFDLLNKNGRDLLPLLNQFSEDTKKSIILRGEANLDPLELLSLKHLICPSISIHDCNISDKPSLENLIENADSTIEEINLLMDRKFNDNDSDRALVQLLIKHRLEALIHLGKFNLLTPNKNAQKLGSALEDIALNSGETSTRIIAKFLQNTLAPK